LFVKNIKPQKKMGLVVRKIIKDAYILAFWGKKRVKDPSLQINGGALLLADQAQLLDVEIGTVHLLCVGLAPCWC
jgi:hypothetical protein